MGDTRKKCGKIFSVLFSLWIVLLLVTEGVIHVDNGVACIITTALYGLVSVGVVIFWIAFLFMDDI